MLRYDHDSASILIVGGGIMGAAVAYNLMKEGARDVLLIDEHETAEGTSWHTPGFMGTVRITRSGDLIAQESVALWEEMAERRGQAAGWNRTGGLRLAQSDARSAELAAMAAQALALGTHCVTGGRELAAEMHRGLFVDDLQYVVYTPDEGWVDAFAMTRALLEEARAMGLRVSKGTRVTGIETAGGKVTGVGTWRGRISCDHVVLAAGCASAALAQTAGLRLPVASFLAKVTVLSAPAGQPHAFPTVRDNDGGSYFRSDPDGVVAGGDLLEPELMTDPNPLATPRINVPTNAEAASGQIAAASHRYPALAGSTVLKVVCGPESISADGECIFGASGIDGLTLATAGSGHGVAFAGGSGKAIAQSILQGTSGVDISEYALSRFAAADLSPERIAEKATTEYVNYLSIRPWLTASGHSETDARAG